jgi:hypothetical protein
VTLLEGEKQPRVQDVRLGERLGLSRPRNLRKAIERNKDVLSQRDRLCSRGEQNTGRGRPSVEYWLTERQALHLCFLARTPIADKIKDEVLDVFMAWREGRLGPAPASVEAIAEAVMRRLGGLVKAVVAPLDGISLP